MNFWYQTVRYIPHHGSCMQTFENSIIRQVKFENRGRDCSYDTTNTTDIICEKNKRMDTRFFLCHYYRICIWFFLLMVIVCWSPPPGSVFLAVLKARCWHCVVFCSFVGFLSHIPHFITQFCYHYKTDNPFLLMFMLLLQNGYLMHVKSGLCMNYDGFNLFMDKCDTSSSHQKWSFQHYNI